MNTRVTSILTLSLVLISCASMVVKEDDIVKHTSRALSLEKNNFKISDRVDDGLRTDYVVTTNTGKKYNCYVEGSFSFGTGSVVTDAICSEIGKTGGSSTPACDALQKKAGKC